MADRTSEPEALRQVTRREAALREGCAALAGWQSDVERAFLGLGDALMQAHGRLRQALDAMAALSAAILDPSGDEAITTLRRMADLTAAVVGGDGERRLRLEELRGGTSDVDGSIAEISRTLRLLQHLAVLARIDAETGRNAGSAELRTFVNDVASLLEHGRKTAGAMAAEIAALAATLQQAWTLESSVGNQTRQRITELSGRLQHLADELDEHRQQTRAAAAEIAQQFDEIWRAVGDVVKRIQFQDALRQRLEHITGGVERLLLVAGRGRLSDDGPALGPDQQSHAIAAIARLEAAQLRRLAADLEDEAAALRSSLGAIALRLTEADRGLDRVYAERRQADGGSILAAVERNVQGLIAVCDQTAAAQAELNRAVGQGVASARTLAAATASMGELETGLRFAGFNATIRAAHISRGVSGTQCIAQEIRDQANHINTSATSLTGRIETLIAAAHALAEEILPQLEARQQELRAGVGRCAATLRTIETTGRQHHGAAIEAAADLPQALAATARGFTVEVAGRQLMLELALQLEAIEAAAGEQDEAPALPALDEILRQRYTMAAERAVHDGHAPDLPAPPPVQPPGAPAAVDLSDVLF